MAKRTPEKLRLVRPETKEHLRDYIRVFFGVNVPDKILVEGHSSPMDYLWYAFNTDFAPKGRINADCVVWASRGGSKTETSAIITALDCIFKPEIEIRILSGSGYQAGRMYEYFDRYINCGYADLIAKVQTWPTKKTTFKNGAAVEVLVQTETSIRGQHVHKLRCDEVELFKPKVFEAAQYLTMSTKGYLGALEVISTMHKPVGLMRKLVDRCNAGNKPVFKWNLWDVIEKCRRSCENCPLSSACQGIAKKGRGYFRVDDAITQLERSTSASFNLEMLCGEGGKKKWGWASKVRLY